MPEAPLPPSEPIINRQSDTKHGYWGPLPGESPDLYKAMGAPMLGRAILRVPEFWRGEFNMVAGRDLGETSRQEDTAPTELTQQKRLERLVKFTQINEAIHTGTFGVLGAVSLWGVAEGGWAGMSFAVVIGAANVTLNIPPIIVQRYNRLRAYRLLDRMSNSRSATTPE
jgi:hypothetical protein